ncbi:phosphopantetheine-binding protein [Nocardia sp. NPDC051321]|uniref:phosphopantetheine-binding protein n=1 Tax=Nocardia sp. NPDC051321 TaxID=3364323 RepID=UPI0037B44122
MGELTYDLVRAHIADVLFLQPDEVGDVDDLFDAGLDSVRLIGLIELWKTHGVRVSFVELAETPMLQAWWPLLARPRPA